MSFANSPINSIDIWTGQSNSTHIRLDNTGNFDTEQLLFKSAARFNGYWFNAAPTAVQYPSFKAMYVFNIDSIEVMRIGSAVGMGSNVPLGPNSWNVNEGFIRIGEQPNTAAPVNAGNRLEIDAYPNTTFSSPNGSCAGSTGFSGLRFTDLTSASTPCVTPPSTNVLSVDANGDVILVPGAVSFGGTCGNTNTMSNDFEIPMGTFNYSFTGQNSNDARVGIGLAAGNCQPSAKLDVRMSSGSSSSISILTKNTDLDGVAIMATSSGGATGANTKVAGWFEASAGAGLQQTAIFVPMGGGAIQVGFNYPTGSGYLVDVNGSLNAISYGPSDARFKENVASLSNGSSFIERLRPVSYDWVDSLISDSMMLGTQYGFIAQEVDTVLPDVVRTNSNGFMSIAYDQILPVLVLAWQEEHRRNDSLASQLDSLVSVVNGCCNSSARTSGSEANQQNVTLSNSESVVLNQNVPNPFAEQTTITYYLPESAVKAQILFYDANGKLIKVVDLEARGNGQLNVFADDLSNGIYSYALVVDGQIADTKKMVKTN